jgi:hypothetical protein
MSFEDAHHGQKESTEDLLVDIEEQVGEERRGNISFLDKISLGSTHNVMDSKEEEEEEEEGDDEFGDWEDEVEEIDEEQEEEEVEPLACVDLVDDGEVVSRGITTTDIPNGTASDTCHSDVPCIDAATTRVMVPSDGHGNASLEQQQGTSVYVDMVFQDSKTVTSREYGDCVRRELGPWRTDGDDVVMESQRRFRDVEVEFLGLLKKREKPPLVGGDGNAV